MLVHVVTKGNAGHVAGFETGIRGPARIGHSFLVVEADAAVNAKLIFLGERRQRDQDSRKQDKAIRIEVPLIQQLEPGEMSILSPG